MNAACQLHVSAIQGTTSGVMIAPTLLPALKMPVANARSRLGNHSAVVLIAAGKLPDSPRPSAARAIAKPFAVRANAWLIAAMLHAMIDAAKPERTPTLSRKRPTPRKPKPYARLNHETMSPYCDSVH